MKTLRNFGSIVTALLAGGLFLLSVQAKAQEVPQEKAQEVPQEKEIPEIPKPKPIPEERAYCLLDNGQLGEVGHYDKIVFTIKKKLAEKLGYPADSELDIKIRDDFDNITDLKGEVLTKLFAPYTYEEELRKEIKIKDVEYAIICELVKRGRVPKEHILIEKAE